MTIIDIRNMQKSGWIHTLRAVVAGQRARLSAIRERDGHHRGAMLATTAGDDAAAVLRRTGAAAESAKIRKASPGSRALRRAAERALAKVEKRSAA